MFRTTAVTMILSELTGVIAVLMDLGDLFDPTLFEILNEEAEHHIGIRIVTKMAKEIRYFSTFKSNNLTVCT